MAAIPQPNLLQLNNAVAALEALRGTDHNGWHDATVMGDWGMLRPDRPDECPMGVPHVPWIRTRNLIKSDEIVEFLGAVTNQQLLDFITTARLRSEGAVLAHVSGDEGDMPPSNSGMMTANPSTALAALLTGCGFPDSEREVLFSIMSRLQKTPRQWFSVFQSMAQLLTAIAGGVANSADPFVLDPNSVDAAYVHLYGDRPVSFIVSTLAVNKADSRELASDGLTYFLLTTGKGTVSADHKAIIFKDTALPIGAYYEALDREVAASVVGSISRECGYGYQYRHITEDAIQIASLFLTVYAAEKVGNKLTVRPLGEGKARTGLWKFFDHPKFREIQMFMANLADPMQKLAAKISGGAKVHNLVTPPGHAHVSYLRVVIQDFLDLDALPSVGTWRSAITALKKIYLEDVRTWEDHLARFDAQFPEHGGARLFSVTKSLLTAPPMTTHKLLTKVRDLAPRRATVEKAGQKSAPFLKKRDLDDLLGIKGSLPLVSCLWQPNKTGRPLPVGQIDPGSSRVSLDDSRSWIRNSETDKVVDGKSSGNAVQLQSLYADEYVPGTVVSNAVNTCREWFDIMHEIKRFHPIALAQLAPGGDGKAMVWEINNDFHFGNAIQKVLDWTITDITDRVGVDGVTDNCPQTCVRSAIPGVIKPGEYRDQVMFFNKHVELRNIPGGSGIDPLRPQSSYIEKLIGAGASALVFRAAMSSEWNDVDEGGVTMPPPLRKIVRNYHTVTFIPGERAHNGIFFVVASNRRDAPIERLDLDAAIKRTQVEWDSFSVRYGIHMYRANALKNLATVLGITAPHVPSESAARNFDHYARAYDYTSRRPDWSSWGITALQVSQVTEMLDVDRSKVVVVGDQKEEDDDLAALMADLATPGSTPLTPATVHYETEIDISGDGSDD